MNKTQQGFSLIEIAIALSIIILLAALIMFSYSRYIDRSRIVEVVNVSTQVRQEIAKHVAKYRKLPNDIAAFMQKVLSGYNTQSKQQTFDYEYTVSDDQRSGSVTLLIFKKTNNIEDSSDSGNVASTGPQLYIDKVQVIEGNADFTCGTSNIKNEQLALDMLPNSCQETFDINQLPGSVASPGSSFGPTSGDGTNTYEYSGFTGKGEGTADFATNQGGRNTITFHNSSNSVLITACPEGKEEKVEDLCYPPCKLDYTRHDSNPSLCIAPCDTSKDWYASGSYCKRDENSFIIDSYGRGVGTPLTCAPNEQYDAGLCYTPCRSGYKSVGPMCWEQCPSGYSELLTCYRWWTPDSKTRNSYGRGVGTPIDACPEGKEKDASLCYPNCKTGYKGIGPVCWQQCDASLGYSTGSPIWNCERPNEQISRQQYNRGDGVSTEERWMNPQEALRHQELESSLSQ